VANYGPVSPPDEPDIDEALYEEAERQIARDIATDPDEVYEMIVRRKCDADDDLLDILVAVLSGRAPAEGILRAVELVAQSAEWRAKRTAANRVTDRYEALLEEQIALAKADKADVMADARAAPAEWRV
jgi:hypothetical protein